MHIYLQTISGIKHVDCYSYVASVQEESTARRCVFDFPESSVAFGNDFDEAEHISTPTPTHLHTYSAEVQHRTIGNQIQLLLVRSRMSDAAIHSQPTNKQQQQIDRTACLVISLTVSPAIEKHIRLPGMHCEDTKTEQIKLQLISKQLT